jgi:hypothetical protein
VDIWIERLGDIPWGALAFVLLLLYGGFLLITSQGAAVKFEDLAGALAVGSGLHGIGHGIRTHGRPVRH